MVSTTVHNDIDVLVISSLNIKTCEQNLKLVLYFHLFYKCIVKQDIYILIWTEEEQQKTLLKINNSRQNSRHTICKDNY